ncbi:dephospho-CoA kinase [Anaeromyxobacter dehalogenans]|uniref:Dephospho-CoA kinase n=1 Tax=Anaeromyxobacter dehalogenans (strain 2CP-C) TaxID=290397 RepID=COAE_ANADE|nr:dephospho-CoA kinase [Anaeromyxobacter dehalogenans]Q2ILC5.1 RecName: Full=Dephospho-CoA kinase; AltName: Full=Dephosphocoenzyme A kinase [Anaeromyxobacter dehalogenans 2CP-C]ABC82454.1 dephospho-CoA kinase [Anaeromyxobacter dehalogenans 2CP-C]
MRVIGLTGGIATGKSTFAALLRARGAPVVDADALARAAVEPGTPALAEIARTFGAEVLRPDGALDRKALGARVFADPGARRRLEAITHPAVRLAMREETARLAAQGHPLAFYDTPLLYEVGLEALLDAVVVVWAPRDVQRERLMRRDGLGGAEADARLAAQLPVDEKAARADFVVENAGAPEALAGKADRLLADLRGGRGRRLPNAPPVRY